jgi:dephospho-CoA kinase
MLLIGLTGNIAAGKSSVAEALAARGACVVDSDVAAREAVAPGSPGLSAIVDTFGRDMLLPDGSLDRARLGTHVFANTEARHALERIVHPAVERSRQRAVLAARADGRDVVVCDIPLLFEAQLAWQFPRIVLVDAPAPLRIARLMRDRQMTAEAAAARVGAQMPAALKRGRADVIVQNDGDRQALRDAIDALWRRVDDWSHANAMRHTR